MTGQKKLQTESTGQLTDKPLTEISNRKFTIPNLYMIFYPPIIEYTGMIRPDPLNVHCGASIRTKIEITFSDAHMPLEENGELTS
jgi:hypothetical protein